MHFFSKFPKERFHFPEGGFSLELIDMSVRIKLLDYIKNNRQISEQGIRENYKINDYKRPEHVAYELYENQNYTWTLLVLNNIYNVYEDWLQPIDLVEKNLIRKYGSIEKANETPVAYYSEFGYEIGESSVKKVHLNFSKRESNYALLQKTEVMIEEYRKEYLNKTDDWIEKLDDDEKIESLDEVGRVIKNKGPQTLSAYEKAFRENERRRYIRVFEPNIIFRIQADLSTMFNT